MIVMEESFARVETKYMLTKEQEADIEYGLRSRGFYWMDFGSPAVQSLYYDTPDCQLIRSSLERPFYKEKLRLRAYGNPGRQGDSFVELKKKCSGVVYKRRVAMPLKEAYEGLNRKALPDEAGQVGREAVWMTKRYNLIPKAVIAYDRDAWFCQAEPDVRITFDKNLAFREHDLDLSKEADNIVFTGPEERLMEIKTNGTYPLWLARLLWETQAKRIHYSKYGFVYQNFMRRM